MLDVPLKEYQHENIEWIQREKRGLLADEPGLGKSRSALEGFAGAERVLIVAPSLVLEAGVWHEEVEKWGDDDTLYYVAPYSMLNDKRQTKDKQGKPRFSTTGNPILASVKALRKEYRGHWDAVIIDEAHYIKGRSTSWTWAVDQLAKNSDNLLLLTGTPIPNWAHEVFTLLRTIEPHEAHPGKKYGSFWRWAEEWFDCSPTRFSNGNPVVGELLACSPRCLLRNADDPCEHYVAFAAANFGPKYMRHLRADHLDLPPLEFIDVSTSMELDARRAYRELKKDFSTHIEDAEILAWSQGAKNVMMDKLTTSPWLLHKEGEPRGGKFEQLRGDLQGRTQPTLVLAHYRDSVEACGRVAESTGARTGYVHGGTSDKQNAKSVRDFKAGALDVLVGSLETLAEGLTLTVADTAIFVERSYKPSRNTQATYRIHRLGQDKACTIRRYITPNSIDSGKEELLLTKTDRQMRTLTAAEFARVS